MKKLLTVMLLLLIGVAVHAQNYLRINITEIQDWMTYDYCTSQYDSVIIEKQQGCDEWWGWDVGIDGQTVIYSICELDEIVLTPYSNLEKYYHIEYRDMCGIGEREFYVKFSDFQLPEPFPQDYIWKRPGESVTLYGGGYGYQNQWSTGSTEYDIIVTQPGTYWVHIYNDCGELYDTIQVRNNVEITLATCDLETNLNMVTWPTTPAQAEYVSEVEVRRDGQVVGTAPYTDGQFIDNIGSDAASRTYTVKTKGFNGQQCSILSQPKETIHMAYLTGINNTIEMNWNKPTGYNITGFNICEWNPDTNELSVIDYVGSSVTSYTCQQSAFDQGYIVVQGVEAGKDGESRLLSNRSSETVGLNENGSQGFKVYPNPSNGTFTVDGTTDLTVFNTLGQVITTSHSENGMHTFTLRSGIYFIKSDEGSVQKVVVE